MPSALLKSYAKEANVSIEKAEECWEQGKKAADAMYGKAEKDGKYWSIVNFRTRECLRLPRYPEKKKGK